ncbi:FG-GAP repeat protein [Candidatus Peregrinibacteria bacterium]|nr:FG-GAP repeat protein [Candidatus Peregrinibacteria bacterium]
MNFRIPKKNLLLASVILFIAYGNYSAYSETFVDKYTWIYELFTGIADKKIEFKGNVPGGELGSSFMVGDFNGDKIDDIAIGAPFASTGLKKWNGTVSVVFGKKFDFPTNYESSLKIQPDLTFSGAYSGDQLGTTITSGDFNNDGIKDIAIGAFNAYVNDKRPGRVYIMYGKKDWTGQNVDFAYNKPDYVLTGNGDLDGFGLTLATMDLNHDYIDDLLVSAPYFKNSNNDSTGVVYGYWGGREGLSVNKAGENFANTVFRGQKADENFGSAITKGDFDGDQIEDVAISAYGANVGLLKGAGKVYVYRLNKDPYISKIDKPNFVIDGDYSRGWFGFSMDAADLNGDRIDDLAISSFPFRGKKTNGIVKVYYGGLNFPSPGILIDGNIGESVLGASVLLKDLDNDKNPEIIIGAPGLGMEASSEAGNVYIINAKGQFKNSYNIKNKEFTSVIHGENPDDWFGYGLSVMDFNGDGNKDLVVSSRYSDITNGVNNGKLFIFLGDGLPYGNRKRAYTSESELVQRGKFTSIIVNSFDLKNTKSDDLQKCSSHKEFCLFNFLAMSSYDKIQLDPNLILYPDIFPVYKYYDDINTATMLGLINGYLNEQDSPFHPDFNISRIEALKIILGAADLIKPMYKFELTRTLGSIENLINQPSYFHDVNAKIPYMWWYPRYVNFAVSHNLVDKGDLFRPDDNITMDELNDIIARTIEFLNKKNEDGEIKS